MSSECLFRVSPERKELGVVLCKIEDLLCGLPLVICRKYLIYGIVGAREECEKPFVAHGLVDLIKRELRLFRFPEQLALLVVEPAAVKPQIQESRIVTMGTDHHLLFLDEEITVLEIDEILTRLKGRKLIRDHLLEVGVVRPDPGEEPDPAGMVLIIEEVKVACTIIACVYDAGFDSYPERFQMEHYPPEGADINDVAGHRHVEDRKPCLLLNHEDQPYLIADLAVMDIDSGQGYADGIRKAARVYEYVPVGPVCIHYIAQIGLLISHLPLRCADRGEELADARTVQSCPGVKQACHASAEPVLCVAVRH